MRRLGSLLVLALSLAACRDSTRARRVAAVDIVPSPANVQRNQTLQLQAVTLGSAQDTIRGRGVTWRVLDQGIATVSSTGLLTGVASGNTRVLASAGGVTDTALVIVSGFSAGGSLSDNFTSYPNTAAFVSNTGRLGLYRVVENIHLAEIDQTVQYAGHQTLRIAQPSGSGPAALVLFVYLPEGVSSMWLRAKVRFSPGWQPSTVGIGGADTFMHWGWGAGLTQRGEISLASDARYRLLWYADGATGPASSDAGAPTGEWTDGRWTDMIVHYQRVDETRTRTRLWMAPDGQTPVLRATTEGTMATGSAPLVDRVRLSPEFNFPVATSQSVWLGQWEIVNGAQTANPFGLPAS